MRGWIMGGHGTCAVQGTADDSLELGHGPLAVVVDDGVVELRRERELALGDVEPLVDLALALRRPQAEPPLALLPARGGDEDRDRRRNAVANRERPAGLDLKHGRAAVGDDAIELRPERSRAAARPPRQLDPLQEVALLELPVELVVAQEPVVAAVLLARAHRAGRRGDGELELAGKAFDQQLCERALALARRPRQDEDRPRARLSG